MTCRVCGAEKAAAVMFHGRCRTCRTTAQNERNRANPEAHRRRLRKYNRKRPAAILAGRARRRNREAVARCTLHPYCSRFDALVVITLGDGVCGLCGQAIADDDFTWEIDHAVPVASGLPGLNCLHNLQPSHRSCNRTASDKGTRRNRRDR